MPLLFAVLLAALQQPAVDPEDIIVTQEARLAVTCQSLGEVKAKSGSGALLGDLGAEMGYEQVAVSIRQRAAEMGANMVLIQGASSFILTSAKGTAYRCADSVIAGLRLAALRRRQRAERSMLFFERAINVGSGFVGLQAGVMSRQTQRVPFRGLPVSYWVTVRNETDAPLVAVARLSYKDTPAEKWVKVFPGKVKPLSWDTFGVQADREMPLEVVFYADDQRTRLQATEKTSLIFPASELEVLKSIRDPASSPLVVIGGWEEMTSKTGDVAASKADSELQTDIIWTLYREESRSHHDCKHSVVDAAPQTYQADDLAAMVPEIKSEAVESLRKRDGALEIWRVKSCEHVTAYRVLMLAAPDGGTDILVTRMVTP